MAASAPRVAVDAMGGDHGARVVVEGAVRGVPRAGRPLPSRGPARTVARRSCGRLAATGLPIDVVDAPDVVGMGGDGDPLDPQEALVDPGGGRAGARRGRRRLLLRRQHRRLLDHREARARAPSRRWTVRPWRRSFPNVSGRTVLLDVGANATCKARHLEEFAVMGNVYTRAVLHIPNPRIGLMSMGEEETKGNDLVQGGPRGAEGLQPQLRRATSRGTTSSTAGWTSS